MQPPPITYAIGIAPPNVFYNYHFTTRFKKSNKNKWLVFGNFYHSTQFGSVYEKPRKIVIQSDITRKPMVSLIYLSLIVRNGQIFLLILDASGYTI
jgi:hypothetical protein